MKNYSDPAVWAAYLLERKLPVEDPPPPPPRYFNECSGEALHDALEQWARVYCRRHTRERVSRGLQVQETLERALEEEERLNLN